MTNLSDLQLYLNELDVELRKKNLPRRDRLILTGLRHNLQKNQQIDLEIEILKKHDLVQKAITYPRTTAVMIMSILIINSMVNWTGVRKPLMQATIYQISGVLIPLDSLP